MSKRLWTSDELEQELGSVLRGMDTSLEYCVVDGTVGCSEGVFEIWRNSLARVMDRREMYKAPLWERSRRKGAMPFVASIDDLDAKRDERSEADPT